MRYQVPQFIEIEDKLFGPLTFRQFVYLSGGVGLLVVLYHFGGFVTAGLVGLPVALLSVLLAFYRINNRPFIFTLEAALKYFITSRLYIWKNRSPQKGKGERQDPRTVVKPVVPKISENKLKDLAWSLDVKHSMYDAADER